MFRILCETACPRACRRVGFHGFTHTPGAPGFASFAKPGIPRLFPCLFPSRELNLAPGGHQKKTHPSLRSGALTTPTVYLIVTVSAFDFPPPGVGFLTTTASVPGAAMAALGTYTVISFSLTYFADNTFHGTSVFPWSKSSAIGSAVVSRAF